MSPKSFVPNTVLAPVFRVALGVLALSALTFAACSNSEEAAPSRTVVPAGTSSGETGTSSGSVGTGDAGPDAAPDEFASCGAVEGCTCTPFDNTARLPRFVAGQPLPAIP